MTSRSLLSTALQALGGIAVVLALVVLVLLGLSDPVDRLIIDAIRASAAETVFAPFWIITEFGSVWGVTLAAVLTLLVGVAIGPWRHGLIGAIVIAVSSIGNTLLKAIVARERPDLLEPLFIERGFSFPSGHAALGMVAYGILAVLVGRSRLPAAVRRGLVIGLGALVGLIGLSRIWLGVHFPTDVVAGWILGGVVVLLYAELTRGVSREPAEAAVDADPAGPRSDRPATG